MTVVNDHSGAGWQKMLYRAFIELQSKTASFPPDLKKENNLCPYSELPWRIAIAISIVSQTI